MNTQYKKYGKPHYDKHRLQISLKRKKAYHLNPEKYKKLSTANYFKNKPYYFKKNKEFRIKIRLAVIRKYGNKCVCCGEKQIEFLAIDHVHNDGAKDRKKHYLIFYKKLLNSKKSSKYRVLCMNCNWGRTYTGTCPHQIKKH